MPSDSASLLNIRAHVSSVTFLYPKQTPPHTKLNRSRASLRFSHCSPLLLPNAILQLMPTFRDGTTPCATCETMGTALYAPAYEFPPAPVCLDCQLGGVEYRKWKPACECCLTSTEVCWPLTQRQMYFVDSEYVCNLCEFTVQNIESLSMGRFNRSAWLLLTLQSRTLFAAIQEAKVTQRECGEVRRELENARTELQHSRELYQEARDLCTFLGDIVRAGFAGNPSSSSAAGALAGGGGAPPSEPTTARSRSPRRRTPSPSR